MESSNFSDISRAILITCYFLAATSYIVDHMWYALYSLCICFRTRERKRERMCFSLDCCCTFRVCVCVFAQHHNYHVVDLHWIWALVTSSSFKIFNASKNDSHFNASVPVYSFFQSSKSLSALVCLLFVGFAFKTIATMWIVRRGSDFNVWTIWRKFGVSRNCCFSILHNIVLGRFSAGIVSRNQWR